MFVEPIYSPIVCLKTLYRSARMTGPDKKGGELVPTKSFTLLLFAIFFLAAIPVRAAQLTYGKYFGTLQMDGQSEAMAVSLDAFVTQVKGPTVYPALEVIVRVNLGGYHSSEYMAYDFYDPTFNFERGILSLNDPKNDLTGSLKVTSTDSETVLEGPVIHRLTNSKGTMRVSMNLDGGDILTEAAPKPRFTTVLKGNYTGTCGKDQANLQIETGRGLGASAPGNAFAAYSITGRLGFTNGPLCDSGSNSKFCSLYPYSTGTYSPFANRITMQGPLGTLECRKFGDELQCKAFGYDKSGACKLTKKSIAPTPAIQIPSSIFLDVPTDHMARLPAPQPPDNEELVKALDGDFYGFLHHENRDVYQLIEMNILASTSTENPHIQNDVIVNPTMRLRLGGSWDDSTALTLVFSQRVFGLNQGFSFQSDDNDYFAVIGDWRRGYVSGVIYSHAYGRVGTFELQKNERPRVSSQMNTLPNPMGNFRGPHNGPPPLKNVWRIAIDIPNQGSGTGKGAVPLLGRYSGPGSMTMFDASSLDLNTDTLSFLISKPAGDRLITGAPGANGGLTLLWPVAPALGAPMRFYESYTYVPVQKEENAK